MSQKEVKKLKKQLRTFTNEDLGSYVIDYLNRTNRLADSPTETLVKFQQRLRAGEDVRDEMARFINDTVRENPEWIPVPFAGVTPEGTVTVGDRLPLRGQLPAIIALEIPEWNRAVNLLRRGMLDRIRECKKPDCKKLFWARFSHSEYHDESCRIAVEVANPLWKERRRKHMREQRQAERKGKS
jgi:hypothetical protein